MESDHYIDPADTSGCTVPVRVNRKGTQDPTVVNVSGITFGANEIAIIAGPCAVEVTGSSLRQRRQLRGQVEFF